jgi:hypothetical protein
MTLKEAVMDVLILLMLVLIVAGTAALFYTKPIRWPEEK